MNKVDSRASVCSIFVLLRRQDKSTVMNGISNEPRILLVVPAYNEEASILSVATSIRDAGYDFVIVNDGSIDSTAEICRANELPLLDLSVNLGIGGAVQTGHLYALEHGYDIDIQFDGDGQHDISSIPALVRAIQQGADLVVGSRFMPGAEAAFRSSFARRLGIKWLSFLIRIVSGERVHDVTSGFRACSKNAIRLFGEDYPIDYPEPESIVVAVKNRLSVMEVPAKMKERQGGSSSIGGFSSLYYMIKVSLAVVVQGLSAKRKGC